jgi:dihydrolipoamide dehydrogenase
MADAFEYDVLIIGSGPGGYVAAIKASQLGLNTAVVEKERLGGVCLNMGCIPSKALIHQAQVFRSLVEAEEMGVRVDRSGLDYAKVFKKSRLAAEALSKGLAFLLKKNKVTVIQGVANIAGDHEVTIDGCEKVTAKSIIIATGSHARPIPGFEFDERDILSSTGALMLDKLPNKICIIGGGAIGVEFAHIMNAFGVEVHLVEMLGQLLPFEDAEIVRVLQRSFKLRGIVTYVGTTATSCEKSEIGLSISLRDKKGAEKTILVDKVLVVVGRVPNTQGIGLEQLGITTEEGYIPVGDYYQTAVKGIYAIGDVIASPLLAHVASREGEIAVEHIAGKNPPARIDPLSIPVAVYCEPQVASFGLTETEAEEKGLMFRKAVFPYLRVGKSVATGKSEGLVKVLFMSDMSEIIGAHIVGAEATEIIHELLLAKTAELVPENIATMIHAHPTLSETILETMRAAEGRAIHI